MTGDDRWRGLRRVFRLPLGRRGVQGEVEQELGFHLEERIEELVSTGMSRAAAEREARERFGDVPTIGAELMKIDRRMVRRRGLMEWLAELRRDVGYAVRSLRRAPAFSLVAVLTLGLGIGANSAIFSVVDGVLLRPAPFAGMNRLVVAWETDRKSNTTREPASVPDWVDYRTQSKTLDRLEAFTPVEVSLAPEGGEPVRLASLVVTQGFLPMVGIAPSLGRNFAPEEGRPGGPPAVLISDALFTQLFHRDPAALGRTIRVNDLTIPVIGVLPPAADFGTLQILGAAAYGRGFADKDGRTRVDLWFPYRGDPAKADRGNHPIIQVGRMAPRTTVPDAQAELSRIAADLEKNYHEANDARGIFVEPLSQVIFGPVRPALLVLLGAVALVLLVACANVTNLLLARGAARMREVHVRAALGASLRRLARQFLLEAAVLTAAGAGLGLGLAVLLVRVFGALAPSSIPRIGAVGINGAVLGVTLGVSALVALGFGLLPTLQARRQGLMPSLSGDSGRGASAGREHRRFRSVLVTVELALAVMLMVGAGLLIKSLWRLQSVNPGFQASGVLKAEFQLPSSRYPQSFAVFPKWPEVIRFSDEVRRQVAALPGVTAVTIANSHPMDAGFTSSIVVPGREAEAADWPEPSIRVIDAGYLHALGVPLESGRAFEASDDAAAPPVLLINAAAAKRFFNGMTAEGQRIRLWGSDRAVVGVIGNERMHGLAADVPPAVYMPATQAPVTSGSILIRTTGNPAALAASLRSIVKGIDPALPLFGIATLEDTIRNSTGERRFTVLLLALFAGVALVLAVVGVHGVLSYTVAQRTREIGIRMALGADVASVRRLVVGQGAVLAVAGLGLGLLGALGLSRVLTRLLFGVGTGDPATFAGVAGLLGAVALLATWMPARRAARVEPVEALRAEG